MQPASAAIGFYAEDSALGCWRSWHWRPAPLAGAVDVLWYFEGQVAHPAERVFPDGSVQLIVQLGGAPYANIEGARILGCPALCVTGLHTRAIRVKAPEGTSQVLGIRLRPLAAHAVLALPLREASNLTLGLEEVIGAAARELADACTDAQGGEARLRAAARWVCGRLRSSHARALAPDPALAWLVRQLEATQGRAAIAGLRERSGYGSAQLQAACLRHLGVSPKRFARLLRFRHAMAQLNSGSLPLSELALATGYYDQPHMNAEFRDFAGLTPGEILHARRYPNTSSLAEAA
ncbi:helix-turn-helix domain-containing protein [Niveibacterium sp. SC-1]|uniref:helix-turn-helix domain-containing protein n=1 Tax=Niveibacterium sp. SC-1 TaxID=3135646 RepID=UPI00311E45D3